MSKRKQTAQQRRIQHMILAMLQESVSLLRNGHCLTPAGTRQADKVLRWTGEAMRAVGGNYASAGYQREFKADMLQIIAIRDKYFTPVTTDGQITSVQGVGYVLACAHLLTDMIAIYNLQGNEWRYLDMTATTFLTQLLKSIGDDGTEESATACAIAIYDFLLESQRKARAA